MTLTDEHAKSLKEQLLKQAENFPEEKREQVKSYILGMDNEQLEEFLMKNKLIAEKQESESSEGESGESEKPSSARTDCVYCLLSNHQIQSLPVYEDEDYIACLEIKPFAEGHVILVPKKHILKAKSLPAKALTLANKIGKHLVKQLKAEDFQVSSSDDMKHAVVNIIPVYKGEKISFERKPADPKKLQELVSKIGKLESKAKKVEKEEAQEKPENPAPEIKESKAKAVLVKLPRRIP